MCLANNATADLKECGVDTIPFAEEKCNTQPCSEVPEPTTEAPLVEVCEDVEVDDDGEAGEEPTTEPTTEMTTEPTATATATTTAAPEQPVVEEKVEKSTSTDLEASGATDMPESLTDGMSAEGSGDAPTQSVSFIIISLSLEI